MTDNVPVVLMDLPTTVRGFVTTNSDCDPVIVINSRMTKEQQRKTFKHEMNHITTGQLYDDNYVEYGDAYG